MDISQIILCENSQGKCRAPRAWQDRDLHFAQACTVEMDMDISEEPFYANLQEKCHAARWSKTRAADFVRACAVEMHMDIAQEPFYARIYGKSQKPDGAPWSSTTLNLTPSVRTPNCVGYSGESWLNSQFHGGTPNHGIFMAQHPTSIAFEAPACAASRDTSAAPPSAGAGSDALGGHLAGGTPWPLDVWKTIGKPKKT